MDDKKVKDICAKIVETGRSLLDKGLITGTWGNLSARVPDSDFIAITPSGKDYTTLTKDEIVIFDNNGKVVGGGQPSSELYMHLKVYHKRSDVAAVVHTHSIFASSCAVARRPILPIIEDLVQIVGGEVSVAEYALPGTEQLADNAVEALGYKQAVLLANHGVVGVGDSLEEAMAVCEIVEKTAKIYLYANSLGGAKVLDDADIKIMRNFYTNKYRRRQKGEADV